MKHDDLKHNASGYYDETAYKALKTIAMPKPGEIWMDRRGQKTFLILQSWETVCSTLLLGAKDNDASLMVMAKVPMYTDPIMIGYTFTNILGEYVKTVPDDIMAEIRKEVTKALGLVVEPIVPFGMLQAKENEVLELTKEKSAMLKEMHTLHDRLEDEKKKTEALKADHDRAMIYKDLYMNLVDKLICARGGCRR